MSPFGPRYADGMGLENRRRAGRPLLASLFVLSALAVACGKVPPSDAGTPGTSGGGRARGGPPPTAEQACTHFSEVFCDALNTCASLFVQVWYGDGPTCRARTKLSCMTDRERHRDQPDARSIAACADAAKTATCQNLLANNLPAACDPVPGPTVDGGVCGSSLQCMSGHCEKGNTSCGTCAPRQAVNGNCSVDEACNKGLVCANQKCVAPRDVGNDCDQNNPCRSSLNCDKTSRKCAMRVGNGAPVRQRRQRLRPLPGRRLRTARGRPRLSARRGCQGGTALWPGEQRPDHLRGQHVHERGLPGAGRRWNACSDAVRCLPPDNCVNGLCRLPSAANCPG